MDGAITLNNSDDDDLDSSGDTNITDYATDDEVDPQTDPIILSPILQPSRQKKKILQASTLPLLGILNARSCYNKPDNLKKIIKELGIEGLIISETWEREDQG